VKGSEVQSAPKPINAMAQTIAEKPSFKHAPREHRCIVPANGFYKWASGQPYHFHATNEQAFSLAGLYEVRKDAEGKDCKTFCIITGDTRG
jgi:putative SOS response-associated peptidase YedK